MAGITVGALIDQLSVFDRQAEVQFGGSPSALDFSRLKARAGAPLGPVTLVQIEFAQQVYRRKDGTPVIEDV